MVAKLTIVNSDQDDQNKPATLPGAGELSDVRKLHYIEAKSYDNDKVAGYLKDCSAINHWANFGPLSMQLESEIARFINLSDELSVVMCSSGTAALHGIIALQETLAGGDLRWATSSFSFFSTIQGSLNSAKFVDCDKDGMLDLSLLDAAEIDGFIVTNTFGQADNIDNYYRYAAAHGKIVCVDAALALGSHQHGANESISFHHTKPWGFGEGGCAIVAREHEELFRNIISFGHVPGRAINRRAFNGKISDVACAYILDRMQQMTIKRAAYQEQYQRIAKLGRAVGMEIMQDVDVHPGTPGSVPLISPFPFENFRHEKVPTGRYYYPLADTPVAKNIHSRIVNIPCHSGMIELSDEDIVQALDSFIKRGIKQSQSH